MLWAELKEGDHPPPVNRMGGEALQRLFCRHFVPPGNHCQSRGFRGSPRVSMDVSRGLVLEIRVIWGAAFYRYFEAKAHMSHILDSGNLPPNRAYCARLRVSIFHWFFICVQSVSEFLWDGLHASIEFPVMPKHAQYARFGGENIE
eukprot:COSAG02_NODE_555_length_20407_cov_11.072878_14_plen_146_part_00